MRKMQTGKRQRPDVADFYSYKHGGEDKQNSPQSQVEYRKRSLSSYGNNCIICPARHTIIGLIMCVLAVCLPTEVTFDHVSICQILCLWNSYYKTQQQNKLCVQP